MDELKVEIALEIIQRKIVSLLKSNKDVDVDTAKETLKTLVEEREKIYIASADFMTRNTVRRVEVAAPVLNEKLKERLDWMFETMMNDDEKGKRLTETGNYADRSLNDVKLNSQEIFYAMAYSNAEKIQKKRED